MTHEAFDLGMLNERDRTAKALHGAAAVAAHHVGRETATVEIQDRLLFVFQRLRHRFDEAARERLAVPLRRLVAHVDQFDGGVAATHAPGQPRQGDLALGRLVVRGHARGCRAHDQPRPGHRSQAPRHPARLVTRRPVLLVRGRTLLVEADQAEARDRCEHR